MFAKQEGVLSNFDLIGVTVRVGKVVLSGPKERVENNSSISAKLPIRVWRQAREDDKLYHNGFSF
jgi:hypothetical protein